MDLRATLVLVAVGLCAVVLSACSGSESASPTATLEPSATATIAPSPTPPPPTPTPVRPEANPFPDALRQSSLQYLEEIALLRNTPVKSEVDMFTLSRDQARAYYTPSGSGSGASSGNGSPRPPSIDPKQEVYELLGLIPEAQAPSGGQQGAPTLQESQIDNLISLITGFYSPDLRALYILETINGGIDGSLARSTIVHELVHALQYQYTDLNGIAAQRANDWDGTTALLSVIEGEAVYTEVEILGYSTRSTYRQPICFAIPAAQRSGTPYVVERELDVWYEDGYCFIRAVAEQRTLDTVFANVPTTMEQILHPEKYLAGEGAKPVTLTDLTTNLGAGWSKAASGTFGEFMVQNILLTSLPNDRAAVQAAAAGWGGDAWSLYVNGDSRLLQAAITWDTTEDAAEFWATLLRALAADGAAVPDSSAASFEVSTGSATWRATLDGATTSLVLTNDPTVTIAP